MLNQGNNIRVGEVECFLLVGGGFFFFLISYFFCLLETLMTIANVASLTDEYRVS